MKRLLIVVPVYGSYRAFLKGLAAWLSARGWEVHVATNTSGVQVGEDVARIHHLSMPRGANPVRLFKAGRALTRLIREIQPTVVHAHFSVGLLCLALTRRNPGSRYLGTFQGMRFPLAKGLARLSFKVVECFSIWRLDQSWVLTEDDFAAVPQFLRSKLAVQDGYGFGCDTQHFDRSRFSHTERSRLRSELGIQDADFVFIFVGRLTAFKGFDLALEAFLELREKFSDVHFLVVGELDSVHPLDLPDLNALSGVHYLGWQEDPAPCLAISNTMIFPSEREGVPVCLMEALAMGVPGIACNTRGVRDLIKHLDNGILVENKNDGLKVALLQIYADRSLLSKLSKSALSKRDKTNRCLFYDFLIKFYPR